MPENINTAVLGSKKPFPEKNEALETMIEVKNVSMVFNMASEQLNSLKEYAIKIVKRELFFEGFTAVDNVSFEIKKGDVFGIIGTNGSGKSTLLKIIAGVLEPTKGSCKIHGSIAPLIELGAGFDPDLTARENIYLNGALLGYSKNFINENFDDIVAFAEIEKFLDMPLKNYSSGMVARIAFAIATVIVPEILIVDEVLSVGDFMFQKKCEDRISELIETHGVTVLIVSHSNDQIARLCSKALWIEKGHIRMMGDAAKLCRVYSALGGRPGKPESEQRVFQALEVETDESPDNYTVIEGDDFYGTAARAAVITWENKKVDTVVFSSSATHFNTIVANGIAGAHHAPVFPTKPDHISDLVEHFLVTHKPKKIFFVDCGHNALGALAHLKQLNWNPEIIEFINDGDLFGLCVDIFTYGKENGSWSETAALVDFSDNSISLAAAPFVYKENCPVFTSVEGKIDTNILLSNIKSSGFESVIIFGNTVDLSVDESLKNAGINVERIEKETTYETCVAICDWTLSNNNPVSNELCVASMSLSQWPDTLMTGAYCAQKNSALLLEDPTNLDSISTCLDFVAERKDSLDTITFFGNESNLSVLDKELLSRELL